MKTVSYMVPVVMLLLSFLYNNNPFVVKEEAQEAFQLLNTIRSNPEKYYKELSLNSKLRITKTPLRWNDTLARVAEIKALDMAKRNYFDHVNPEGYGINFFINQSGYKLNADWLKDKKENYFESIGAGHDSGEAAIKALIIDAEDASKGHRDHLLGIGDFDATLLDVGIGFVKCDGGKYPSYTCIVIAKHNW
ncbi:MULTISPECIES: CAP domain-containing protein [Niastella]|uniref:CAP domain-containing protein n=1 Tax=Niastella soli TaxID=2821487 RepID=A0ABS3Z098_9BACT|nr:CAP domain-containing protein [Niastella soli]MBO9203595.1 CAP domain-containing protein [Niastella soli]